MASSKSSPKTWCPRISRRIVLWGTPCKICPRVARDHGLTREIDASIRDVFRRICPVSPRFHPFVVLLSIFPETSRVLSPRLAFLRASRGRPARARTNHFRQPFPRRREATRRDGENAGLRPVRMRISLPKFKLCTRGNGSSLGTPPVSSPLAPVFTPSTIPATFNTAAAAARSRSMIISRLSCVRMER